MTSSDHDQSAADPLESLLIDSTAVNRAEIAQALKDIVAIDSNTGAVVFRHGSKGLTAREKVHAYLLGRKVSYLLEKIEVEGAMPKTIIEDTGIAPGTVHPTLKALREDKLVSQDAEGRYLVAQNQIADAIAKISKQVDKS